MLVRQYRNKFLKYVDALAHLFNTGQGIVMEKSPYNDYCYVEAEYKQGWIERESRKYYNIIKGETLMELLRPNLIIYLDAPTSVVQANIRKRAETTHPWEKNSPVYENTDYMNHWADLNKTYLKEARKHSQVLVYDWSEEGDPEVVVEDIEALNMDYHDKYDKQQKDWRMHLEEHYSTARGYYTNKVHVLHNFEYPYFSCDKIWNSSDENVEWDRLSARMPGNKYVPGYNESEGDSSPAWRFGGHREPAFNNIDYQIDPSITDRDSEHEDRVRAKKREAGDPKWWI